MRSHSIRVLLINDNEDDYAVVRDLLSNLSPMKFIIKRVSDYGAALDAILSGEFDVSLLDYRLKERNGLELMREALSRGATIPIVFLTGREGYDLDLEAMSNGAADWLAKDELSATLLERAIHHAMERQRKRGEALRESREFLDKIVNSTSDPIYVVDREHRYVLANDALCALAGRKHEDILGRTDYDFFPKEQVDIFWQKDELVFETGQENENEEEITDANGRIFTVVTKKTLYTDSQGNKFIVGIIRNITRRKDAELALQASHQQLQDIIEFLPDATLVIDRDKKVTAWNRAMEKMTGLKKCDILGRGDYAYAVPLYGEKRAMLIDLVMAEESEIESRYDSVKRVGNTICGEAFAPGAYRGKGAYLWSTAAPLIGGDGSAIGSIQVIRDITERKLAEKALAEEAIRLKSIRC
jgi:PAS domain S-box-containing protein